MPFRPGIEMSRMTTSGRSSAASRTAFEPVARLADDRQPGLALEQGAQPVAEDLVIVGEEDAQVHAGPSVGAGRQQRDRRSRAGRRAHFQATAQMTATARGC